MIKQGFSIGERDWYIMAYYDVQTKRDLSEVREALLSAGCTESRTDEALWVLSMWNKGYTLTNLRDHLSIVVVSKATSGEELYDSVQHELKHLVEHISEYYDVSPKSEESAYLQGEIAKKMYLAVAMLICPKCR